MSRNVHDNNPLPAICYARWKSMTWQEAVEEAAILFHLAVQLDEVRERESIAKLTSARD